MAEPKVAYRCQQCNYLSTKWLGRCPECQTWHSLVEEVQNRSGRRDVASKTAPVRPMTLAEVPCGGEVRWCTGMGEWDRVLGGGMIPGSMVLLAGDPGIGKSTLLLQALALWAMDRRVLYVSGEESPQQIKLRADRLQLDGTRIQVLAETSLEPLLDTLEHHPVDILALDSIQTISSRALDVAPGSVSQVRECASQLMRMAKEKTVSVFVVGHVTKEGAIAGPRALEHLVDTVLYLEGDRTHTFRILRAVKNRYGSTNEIGVFEMKETGLDEVPNPSQLLLAERPVGVSGSVVVCSVEGTRPLLVELQALVSGSGWVQPRRTSMGVDANRLSLLLAVMEKKLGFNFSQQDVFVNVAGGVRLVEPAVDLAMMAALMSSTLDRPVPPELVIWGEVGLAGEVRGVTHGALRVAEALKLGFENHLIPRSNAERLPADLGAQCTGIRSLQEVLDWVFPKRG
jgi:DNA repair protein RadA/Sms